MERVSKKIKVLMILPTLNLCGGIENFAISYYRELKDKVKFDFITHEINNNEYKNEIERGGNNVYCLPKFRISNIIEIHKLIKRFFKEHNDYDIVHCNMVNAAYIYLKEAKKYNIKVRIMHSHQNKYSDNFIHAIRNIPLIFIGKKYVTDRIACSEEAGKFLFGKKDFIVIKNAIDTTKFKFNNQIREKMRRKLGVQNKFVIGSVGRFSPQKNQAFLIDVFLKIKMKHTDSKLILIGEGKLKDFLVEKGKKYGILKDIIFIEPNDIVNDYLQAFDIFVLPSLYEGLGIVNIEAQATGLHTILSNNVPREAKVTENLVDFLSLSDGVEYWANFILKNKDYIRKNTIDEIAKNGYDIHMSSKELYDFYIKILKRKEKK